MKTISAGLTAHLAQRVTTLATLWHIIRTDGVELFFTDHDVDIVFDSDTYLAASGYKRSAVANNVSLSVDNVDVKGIFTDQGLTEEDLRTGLYDYAEVKMSLINWADISDGILKMRRGKLGEVSLTPQGFYQAELRGMSQLLTQNLVKVYTSECRTDLGSVQCGVPIEPTVLTRNLPVALGAVYRVPTKSLTGVDWLLVGKNLGFEESTVGSNLVAMPGWVATNGDWDILTVRSPLNPQEGSLLLFASASTCSLEQIVPLEPIGVSTAEIDAGNVTVDFSIYLASTNLNFDQGKVVVQFLDEDGVLISTGMDTGFISTAEDVWTLQSITGSALPVGTRSIKLELSALRIGGFTTEVAFDGGQLSIHETARTNTFQEVYENRFYEVTVAGTTAGTQPAYDTVIGNPTVDGGATLVARDAWMRDGSVALVVDSRTLNTLVSDARAVDGWFEQGAMIYESGPNTRFVHELRGWTQTDGVLVVFLPPPFEVVAGTKFRLYPGCDKRLTTCVNRFSNVLNFRGEPFIPGQDEFARFADVR